DAKSSNWTLTVTVPTIEGDPERQAGNYTSDHLAPLANVRILGFDKDGKTKTLDFVTTIPIARRNEYCNVPKMGTLIDNGSVSLKESKNWQPVGGEVELTIVSLRRTIQTGALIKTCFRWKLKSNAENFLPFAESDALRMIETLPNSIKLAASVPRFVDWNLPIALAIVPQADIRVMIFDDKLNLVLDAV